jgi:hypothetical protein
MSSRPRFWQICAGGNPLGRKARKPLIREGNALL